MVLCKLHHCTLRRVKGRCDSDTLLSLHHVKMQNSEVRRCTAGKRESAKVCVTAHQIDDFAALASAWNCGHFAASRIMQGLGTTHAGTTSQFSNRTPQPRFARR